MNKSVSPKSVEPVNSVYAKFDGFSSEGLQVIQWAQLGQPTCDSVVQPWSSMCDPVGSMRAVSI